MSPEIDKAIPQNIAVTAMGMRASNKIVLYMSFSGVLPNIYATISPKGISTAPVVMQARNSSIINNPMIMKEIESRIVLMSYLTGRKYFVEPSLNTSGWKILM